MSESLKDKTKKGLIWCTIERIATQGIQFVFTILLARLLSPDVYGIIAMPLIFLAIAQVFVDSGFTNALIRKKDLTEEDLSTAFIFNILVGMVCYIVLYLLSPLIADFYNTPILSSVLKVTALATLFNPLCAIQQTVLTKRMNFRLQAYITVVSSIVSGIIGVWMAYNGYGVWSLVFQQVSSVVMRMLLLWLLSKWKPILSWSKSSFRYLWNFGSKIVVVGLIDTIYNNAYTFIIGKLYTAKDLGNYTRAQQFVELPINNVNSVMQRVTLPVLSEIQDENERLNAVYVKLLRCVSMVMFPLMIGLASVAEPLVRILLGDQWMGCVLMFQILCFAKIWTPLNAVNVNLLQLKGRSDLFLKAEIIKKIVLTVIITATFSFGIIPMLLGYGLAIIIVFFINCYYTKKLIGLTYSKQVQTVVPFLIYSITMFLVVLFATAHINSLYLQALAGGIIGMAVYSALLLVFNRQTILEFKELIKRKK